MAIHKIDGVDGVDHFPKKFVTLYASAACTKGFFVAISTDTTNGLGGSVANAPLSASATRANSLTLGIATETVAAGNNVVIQTAGKYENAYVDSSTIAQMPLTGPLSGGTIGMAGALAETTFGPVIAVGLEEDTVANYADVMIIDQGFF